jgi:hypothetical protein
MIKETGDKMGQLIDLYGDAQKLGQEPDPEGRGAALHEPRDRRDESGRLGESSLAGAGDGAPGMFAQGGSLAEG